MSVPQPKNQVQREIDRGSNTSPILEVEVDYQPKKIPVVVGHHNYDTGYMDEREFRLQLLAIRDAKERSYTSGLVEAIENTAHISGKTHAERGFIFGDKKFLEPKDLKKIRDLLTSPEFGFKVDFINNSPENNFIPSKLSYHELLVKFDEQNRPIGAVMFMSTNDKSACYDLEIAYVGNVDTGQLIHRYVNKWTKRRVFQATFKTARHIQDYGDGPFVTFREEVMEDDAEMALPSFYPAFTAEWNMTVQQFARAYQASRAPVLLLYGPTGTGKTTFVRTMAKELNAVLVATSDARIASSGALIDTYRDMVKQAVEDKDPRPVILLLEDLDMLLMTRLNNNREMARLLNETKGITSNKGIYVIFSTNLTELDSIDAALLRPGRCFAKLNIGKLTLEQANVVRKDLNYDDFDLSHLAIDGMISLSEAIDEMRLVTEEANVKKQVASLAFQPAVIMAD